MKNVLHIALFVLLGFGMRHFAVAHQRWKEWDRARTEADNQLVSETKAYQSSFQYQILDCPSRKPLSREDLLVRVGQDRMRAIQVMRQKPGTLTEAEARRLEDYSAWFSRLAK